MEDIMKVLNGIQVHDQQIENKLVILTEKVDMLIRLVKALLPKENK